MLKNIFILLLPFLFMNCTGQGREGSPGESGKARIIVAAAANVQFAMNELETAAEQDLGLDIEVVISSSGKLTAQILQGAPYDLLLSANMMYPNQLFQAGKAAEPPKVYAYGALVLWTLKDLPIDPDPHFLLDPAIRKVAIANPKNAPYGEQAVRVFKHYGIYEQIKPKLVFGESIAQTNQYILSEACEAGLTAKSVVLSPEMKGQGKWWPVDQAAYSPIEQGAVITSYGQQHHPLASRRFLEFLFTEKAKGIFQRYGYSAD